MDLGVNVGIYAHVRHVLHMYCSSTLESARDTYASLATCEKDNDIAALPSMKVSHIGTPLRGVRSLSRPVPRASYGLARP